MATHPNTRKVTLAALIIATTMAAFAAQPAAAQTAGNVKCNGCVNSKDIKNGQVKKTDLASNAVNGAKVKDGSLTTLDLGDGVGVEFVGGLQRLNLPLFADTVVRSITVTAPKAGFVIVNASGSFNLLPNANVGCSLTTGTAFEPEDQQDAGLLTDRFHQQFFAMTEGFVVAAGTTTFNLVCREFSEGVQVIDSDLTAIYAPVRY